MEEERTPRQFSPSVGLPEAGDFLSMANHFIGQDSSAEEILSVADGKLLMDVIKNNEYTICRRLDDYYSIPRDEFNDKLKSLGGTLMSWKDQKYMIIKPDKLDAILTVGINQKDLNNNYLVKFSAICSDKLLEFEFAEYISARFKKDKGKRFVTVGWWVSTPVGLKEIELRTEICETIYNEAYPYIKNLDGYINRFLNDSQPVLILKGVPGTGKTRLIRYIIQTLYDKKGSSDIIYSMDENVFGDDTFFISFLRNNYDMMVLEDIDLNLKPRKDGNTFMHKLLGGSDGLVLIGKKKIIISTNIPNINEMDEALIRPGRCFDILETRKLTRTEAQKLLVKIKGNKELDSEKYSLAEIYNE